MASEDNETRLRAELASLRSSHSALQAQVKMALLSEASSEGERSRQVREDARVMAVKRETLPQAARERKEDDATFLAPCVG